MFFSNKGKEVLVSFAVYCGFFVVGDAVFGQKGTTVALGQTLRPCFVETDRHPPPPTQSASEVALVWVLFSRPEGRHTCGMPSPYYWAAVMPPLGLRPDRLSPGRTPSRLRRPVRLWACGPSRPCGEFERQFHAGGDTYSFYVKMPVI